MKSDAEILATEEAVSRGAARPRSAVSRRMAVAAAIVLVSSAACGRRGDLELPREPEDAPPRQGEGKAG